MPTHPFALTPTPRPPPLAVSSANRSGEPSPREIPAILEQLGDHVGVFFDAGPAAEGPASSIVDLSGRRPRLLREGAIPAGELERVLEEPFDDGA
jgi:L-threonylcarbamoyladenylate synthase